MTFGSLFAGLGGIDLGLERAGLQCAWQVEKDDYALAILKKHWPYIPRWRDVRYFLGGKRWRRAREAWAVDLIAGGFPCQDISNAGKRAGITGSRSGLWTEFARIVRLLRPSYVFVENVPAITIRGLGTVVGDLATMGFNAEWACLPAAAMGAPHPRWRLFLVAYRQPGPLGIFGDVGNTAALLAEAKQRGEPDGTDEDDDTDANGRRREGPQQVLAGQSHADIGDEDAASNANSGGESQSQGMQQDQRRRLGDIHQDASPDSASRRPGQRWRHEFAAYCESQGRLLWPDVKPGVCGVAAGVPHRVDRLRCLGNSVLPQIAEWIGKRILIAHGVH